MKLEDKIRLSIDVSLPILFIVLIVWSLFVYTLGSVLYECKCELLNMQENLAYTGVCKDSLTQQQDDKQWLESYTRNTTK